jgi:hypothetical protein
VEGSGASGLGGGKTRLAGELHARPSGTRSYSNEVVFVIIAAVVTSHQFDEARIPATRAGLHAQRQQKIAERAGVDLAVVGASRGATSWG